MPRLFSYVVHHDLGFAPNPFGRLCTLAKCKCGGAKKRNIVEMAEEGDWIVGTGGADLKKSAGHGKLIYAMRVDEKIPLAEYCRAMYGKRIDAERVTNMDDRYALISRHFFYFGRHAIEIPQEFLSKPLEKKGPGYRRDYTEEFIKRFITWLESAYEAGRHGPPCKPHSGLHARPCRPKVRRKRCGQ